MSMKNVDFWNEDVQICLHGAEDPQQYFGSVNPPIIMSSLFSFPKYADLMMAMEQDGEKCVYSRGGNPTVQFLEKKIAMLERGETALCFGSGMGAISAALFSLLKSGDHVLVINNIYGPVLQYLNYVQKNGITFTQLLDDFEIKNIEKFILKNTKLIYFESPGTMMFHQLDIKKLTRLAAENNILTMTDNSWASPMFQKPITMGVDIVVHSISKYISGHSDLVGGVLITKREIMSKIYACGYMLQGSVMASQDAYLVLRSLRTLPVRMKQHESSSIIVAEALHKHPKVFKVNHPHINESQKRISREQLLGCSGLFSFNLDTQNLDIIEKIIDRLRLHQKGVSWGGFESLAISPHFRSYDAVKNKGVDKGIIRISVGLEPVNLIIEDLEQALDIL